jgi:L-iditol 2-dehydrogenase
VRPAGQVTKVGWGPQPIGCSLDPIVQKAVTLQGSFSHTYPVWERVISLLSTGALDPVPLISRTGSLHQWQACFDGMGEGRLIKAVLLPNGEE